MRPLITAVIAILALAAAAVASADPTPVQPLRDAGYSVGVASELGDGCTSWSVSGHGVSTYVNDCDPDAANTIGSLTNPQLIFERDWQLNHPDQVQAASAIAASCYSISRTAPATDQWHVVGGGTTDTTVAGDQLPGLASSLPNLRLADGTCPTGTTAVIVPGTGTTTVTNPDGTVTTTNTVTVPGSATVVSAVDAAAQAQIEAQRPEAITEANTAAADTLTAAVDSGVAPDEAALAARSAGLNAYYGLD